MNVAHADDQKIFVSFTTKGQDFKTQIFPMLQKLATQYPHAILVHGFASRKFLSSRNIPTEVLDGLDSLFPGRQIQMTNEAGVADASTRARMAESAAENFGHVYVIGSSTAVGVAEEVKLYHDAGVIVELLPLASE